MKIKQTNKILALAFMAVAMVLVSCSKDDDINNVPSQQEIETKIIGKWKRQTENGKPVPTNVSTVLTFAKDGQSSHSFYYYDEANKPSYGETTVNMWYHKATTYLCLFAVDNISGRKTVISYKKH